MSTRRDFIRRGALWVAGAALVEPKRLWAFPVNPAARMSDGEYLKMLFAPSVDTWADYNYRWVLLHTSVYLDRKMAV